MTRMVPVAPVGQLQPGQVRVVTTGNVEIGVFNVAGEYYALPNLCVHQWGPLCEGPVSGTFRARPESGWRRAWEQEGQVVICPWHSLEFDITTGQCLAYPKVRLRQYPVSVQDETIVVHV